MGASSYGTLIGRLVLMSLAGGTSLTAPAPLSAETIRSQAVVNLTFDEPQGAALDNATTGSAKDNGTLANQAKRIPSPFLNQAGKQALLLDASARQAVSLPDSTDLDRPDGVTLALFVLNLDPLSDSAAHGLLGKRVDGPPKTTNYGINSVLSRDTLQVYVRDGGSYKVATYSAKAVLGYRQAVYLTAVFQVGDAPTTDTDTENDDLLIRLYADGKPVNPKSVTAGVVAGTDAWLTDVKGTALLNDVPLVLGGSTPTSEYSNCVLDEFSLFAKALSAEEVARLYDEVAGTAAERAAAALHTTLPTPPQVSGTSLYGLQSGAKTTLTITGNNLLPAPQLLSDVPLQHQVLPGGTAGKLQIEVAVPAETSPGCYPFRVRTTHGVSPAFPLCVESLPQIPLSGSSSDKPVTLPVAVSGNVTGQQAARVYFHGKKDQHVVIDIECRRLGASMSPVLELHNERGTPVQIQWGHPQHGGDPRLEYTIPVDGVYSAVLHDLSYKAAGQNPFRIKLGDLKIVDAAFPPVLTAGQSREVEFVGVGLTENAHLPASLPAVAAGTVQRLPLPAALGAVAPGPTLLVSSATEFVEQPASAGALQPVDVRFVDRPHVPVAISGRISQPDETDRYLLQVKPGATLHMVVESRRFDSPLDGELQILSHPEGKLLASSDDKTRLDYAVPAGTDQVQLAVRDLSGRGSSSHLYHVVLRTSGQPAFDLSLGADRLSLARDGSAVVRLEINRQGYNGPIRLQLVDAPEVSIHPAEIPANAKKALLTLSFKSGDADTGPLFRSLRLIGESVGLTPAVRRVAQSPANPKLAMVVGHREDLSATLTAPLGAKLELGKLPTTLYRGIDVAIPVKLAAQTPPPGAQAVRFTLLTTESPRPVDARDPKKGMLPLLRSLPEQWMLLKDQTATLRLDVPLNVAEPVIDCVVQAEFVPHAFSDSVLATVVSEPFRLTVKPAAKIELAAKELVLLGNARTKLVGTLKRSAGFTEPVELVLQKLPAGYTAAPVTLPPDQEKFELVVTAPPTSSDIDLKNISLKITTSRGKPLQRDLPVVTKVRPGT